MVGDVGSGKSSFLAALLGQMNYTNDNNGSECIVHGSISYAPQEAWLLDMSLRDNIRFGSDYDPKHYNRVIKVCALERDLKLMADGDQTEIGERGINLSGGQRQRISLARCCDVLRSENTHKLIAKIKDIKIKLCELKEVADVSAPKYLTYISVFKYKSMHVLTQLSVCCYITC